MSAAKLGDALACSHLTKAVGVVERVLQLRGGVFTRGTTAFRVRDPIEATNRWDQHE